MDRHARVVVPRGTIRRLVGRTRGLRTPNASAGARQDTAAQARLEIAQTIPVFDVDAGRAELDAIMTRARNG